MPGLLVFFPPVRHWAVNWRCSYSDSLMKDQGSVLYGPQRLGQEEQLIVYLEVRR